MNARPSSQQSSQQVGQQIDQQFLHWTLTRDAQGIAWATLDRAGESTNALSAAVMAELGGLLDALERTPPKALIFRSGKAAGFIAGADVHEFGQLDSADAARHLVARGWDLFNRLAGVGYPTLALIRGHCLGGGLELALACRYRVVVDDPAGRDGARLGLPEVMLGIFPGWGGMQRLPRLIGPSAALDLMLTGKTVDARKARRLGLADLCVPARLMDKSAAALVLSGRPPRRLPLAQRLLAGPLRGVVAAQARKQVARKAPPEHYPAPYAIIEFWARHDGNALAAPAVLDRIVRSPTAKNLVRVFHLQERLKGFGKETGVTFQRVHVVGAGVMGGDIAAWCALRGLTVTLQDTGIERIAPAIARAKKLFDQRLKDALIVRAAMDRLIPDPDGHGAAHADVVIEAIVENLEVKQGLFRKLEGQVRPDAVLATNTSSLRLEDIAATLARPGRLVGIHFFNPVARMPLVEVVAGPGGEAEMAQRACAFVKRIDKLPLPVKSAPGFLVNAVLAPYMLEAMRCVDEGIAPEAVDAAMEAFGMPMGPLELADTVGLDVALAAGRQLAATVGAEAAGGAATPAAGTGAGSAAAVPRCLAERVARGELGRKSGRGFYAYVNGRPQKARKARVAVGPSGLAERLVAPLLERTRALVDQGIVADADLADAGVIFGTGFAPFTGGPLNYLSYLRNRHD